jgi:hypothetical protein
MDIDLVGGFHHVIKWGNYKMKGYKVLGLYARSGYYVSVPHWLDFESNIKAMIFGLKDQFQEI